MAREERPGAPPRRSARHPPVDTDVVLRVQASALASLSPAQRETTTLYVDPYVVEADTALGPRFESVRVARPSILVFADDVPAANFAHPCRYFLYDAETGKPRDRVLAQFPPYPVRGLHSLRVFHRAVFPAKPVMHARRRMAAPPSDDDGTVSSAGGGPPPAAEGRRFAILFAGLMNMTHLNNLELTYRTLIDFGFAPGNIFRLIHDGTPGDNDEGPYIDFDTGAVRPWPGDAADSSFHLQPTGKGTKQAFREVLRRLDQDLHLTSNDLLFIHTEGHGQRYSGTPDDHAFLCAFPNPSDESPDADRYFAYEMGQDVGQLRCGALLVLMNQCYGGGFKASVVTGTYAAATFIGCAADASSFAYAMKPDLIWNEFSLHWLEAQRRKALGGNPVDADSNENGKIEAYEAFCHAKDTETYGDDTPNSCSKPSTGAGERIVLSA
jgi:hypothetical protein